MSRAPVGPIVAAAPGDESLAQSRADTTEAPGALRGAHATLALPPPPPMHVEATLPRYLLFTHASKHDPRGDWRFVLQSAEGQLLLEASDREPASQGERLELLAVVRGLEAVDRPARVSLVNPSSYVSRGMAYGLDEWRQNGWLWEAYGTMLPVKNRDLWQRFDNAQRYLNIECRRWRIDPSHALRAAHARTAERLHDAATCFAPAETPRCAPERPLPMRNSHAALPSGARNLRVPPSRSARWAIQALGGARACWQSLSAEWAHWSDRLLPSGYA